jgi:saccharopine dehydrogenase (NAD+, L-lysine forming)
VDVSCDPNNVNNPLPIYSEETTCENPCLSIPCPSPPPLTLTSISHLPTLLPKESSEFFSGCLIDSLLRLPSNGSEWERARAIFQKKVEEAKQ